MDQKRLSIVAFGDSITLAGEQKDGFKWPQLLADRLSKRLPDRQVEVINAGVGGNTSREGLARIEKDVLSYKPDFMTIEFGGNDATYEPERHVDLAEFTKNLGTICQRAHEVSSAAPIMLTFTPVIDDWHGYGKHEFFREMGGLDGYVEQYRKATRAFASERGIPLVDLDLALRNRFSKESPGEFILQDGVHLTTRGNEVVAEEIFKTFNKIL